MAKTIAFKPQVGGVQNRLWNYVVMAQNFPSIIIKA